MTADRHPFVAAVADGLERIGAGGSLLVACSGGGDSLALLRACVELNREVTAGCFDHRQRDASQADGSAVASFARQWGCAFLTGAFDGPRGASEAELRNARYAWLAEAAAKSGAGWVLTGHTADDQAETVLHRVIRGTGPDGLGGIPPVGRAGWRVPVGRPMLSVTGAAARAFLSDRGIVWREDATNADPAFTRNRLRHEVLPLLETINPRVRAALCRLADAARDEREAVGDLLTALSDRVVRVRTGDRIELDDGELPPTHSPARVGVVRAVWREAAWPERRMDRARWLRLATLAEGERTALPHGVTAERGGGRLVLTREPAGPAGSPTG